MSCDGADRRFYVYAHCKAGTNDVFYVGKGTGQRAWSRGNRNQDWRAFTAQHAYDVVIVDANLTEAEAYATELEMIEILFPEGLVNLIRGGGGGLSGKRLSERGRVRLSAGIRASELAMRVRREFFKSDRNPAKKPENRLASSERMKAKNPSHDPEVLLRMSNSKRGVKQSEEQKRRLSLKLKGVPTGRFPDKARKAFTAYREKTKRPVITGCGLWFPDMRTAQRLTGARQGVISNCCAGRSKTAGGYTWRFADETDRPEMAATFSSRGDGSCDVE